MLHKYSKNDCSLEVIYKIWNYTLTIITVYANLEPCGTDVKYRPIPPVFKDSVPYVPEQIKLIALKKKHKSLYA
jgi:hypothetical protein